MRWLREVIGHVVSMLTPWPSRRSRHADIEQAQKGLAEQRARLAQVQRVQSEIETIQRYSGNHFAQRVANQIARGYQRPEAR